MGEKKEKSWLEIVVGVGFRLCRADAARFSRL
jgi:hypothetical protein